MSSTRAYETEWNIETETNLFYSMIDHKPVGENKHFHMMFIYEKFNNLNERRLNTDKLWQHLEKLYDLQALDDNESVPFPNEEEDFSLPEIEYAKFLHRRRKSSCHVNVEPDENNNNNTSKKDSLKAFGTTSDIKKQKI